MDFLFFLKGIIVGFALAIPIGPIGIICIRKTLFHGSFQGRIIGIAAATADMFYSSIAAFGFTYIANFIEHERLWIKLIGGALLIIFGIKTFLTKPNIPDNEESESKGLKSFISTMFLTLSNPLTFFVFIAIFSTIGIEKRFGILAAFSIVIGVFTGSFCWFLSLSTFVIHYRKKMGSNALRLINKIAGALIIISGFISLVGVFLKFK